MRKKQSATGQRDHWFLVALVILIGLAFVSDVQAMQQPEKAEMFRIAAHFLHSAR